MSAPDHSVIPANAGIQFAGPAAMKINQMHNLDSGIRRNDGRFVTVLELFTGSEPFQTTLEGYRPHRGR